MYIYIYMKQKAKQNTFMMTKGLHRQLTPTGYSQTQILQLNKSKQDISSIYECTYIFICAHTNTHTHIHTHTHTHIYIYIYIYIHTKNTH